MHTGTDYKSSVSDCSGYLQSSLWRGGPLWGAAGGGLALEWGLLSQTKAVESVPEGSIHPPTSCHSSSQNRDQSKRPSTHRRSRLMRVRRRFGGPAETPDSQMCLSQTISDFLTYSSFHYFHMQRPAMSTCDQKTWTNSLAESQQREACIQTPFFQIQHRLQKKEHVLKQQK